MENHAEHLKDILDKAEQIYEDHPCYSFTHIWASHGQYCFNKDGSINKVFA